MRLTLQQREKIRLLRSEGCTYVEIQNSIGIPIPKSTLSYICRDVVLPLEYEKKMRELNKNHLASVRYLAIQKNQQIRAVYLQKLRLRNLPLMENLNIDSFKIALAMLYLGEGSKWRSYRGLSLGSSDVSIIKLYINLLRICYGVKNSKLRARVQYRADQDLNFLEDYWSKTTGIPRSQFYKTIPDPRTVGKPTKREDYRGVCVIMCSGTEIQLELAIISELLLENLGH